MPNARSSFQAAREKGKTGERGHRPETSTNDAQKVARCVENIRRNLIAGVSNVEHAGLQLKPRRTVAPTNPSGDLQSMARELRTKSFGLASEAMWRVHRAIREDHRVAYRFLSDLGFFPSATERARADAQVWTQELLDQYKRRCDMQLRVVACDRNEKFGTELPIGVLEEGAPTMNAAAGTGKP
jgi:hypothetical protein